MLLSILKYRFSAFFMLVALGAMAQRPQPGTQTGTQPGTETGTQTETQVDTATVEPPPRVKVPKEYFIPTGLRIGTDLIAGIKGYRSSRFDGWEFNGDVDFYRYYLALDYGHWSKMEPLNNGFYHNDGTYWRLGADVSFLKKDPDRNMFFLGLRYAHSSFSDDVSYLSTIPNFGIIQKDVANDNLTASWIEITSGLRVKIWKFFWMGYTARIKLSPKIHGEGELKSFDIPGYGLAGAKNYWGFNYQLFFRIPIRKQLKPFIVK
jgi:hypothetical protein